MQRTIVNMVRLHGLMGISFEIIAYNGDHILDGRKGTDLFKEIVGEGDILGIIDAEAVRPGLVKFRREHILHIL